MLDSSLLPEAGETLRCGVHARRHDYDPGGTAMSASTLLVAELAGPWPKPVFEHPALTGLSATIEMHSGTGRILAAVPPLGSHELRLHRFDRGLDGALAMTHVAETPDDIRSLISATTALDAIPAEAVLVTEPVVLLCTQGTHDVCCGIEGTRLALELEQAGFNVMRVSHTGGHRFAPTALTLPSGRMWAYLDAPLLAGIIKQTLDPAHAAALCRGWWGAAPGAAQAAERAVFAQVGWAWERMARSVALQDQDGARSLWSVTGNGATWHVRTEPGRTVPVLACRASGGLPAKEATEYSAVVVARP
ncbi:MAG TPA: sucrase ferredoxin [Acidimicrobiia bacterium]|nr:sucrase ferredoxin [Acidimicrobiia bacterium]